MISNAYINNNIKAIVTNRFNIKRIVENLDYISTAGSPKNQSMQFNNEPNLNPNYNIGPNQVIKKPDPKPI